RRARRRARGGSRARGGGGVRDRRGGALRAVGRRRALDPRSGGDRARARAGILRAGKVSLMNSTAVMAVFDTTAMLWVLAALLQLVDVVTGRRLRRAGRAVGTRDRDRLLIW